MSNKEEGSWWGMVTQGMPHFPPPPVFVCLPLSITHIEKCPERT